VCTAAYKVGAGRQYEEQHQQKKKDRLPVIYCKKQDENIKNEIGGNRDYFS
jgi:hypothetical protein